MSIWLSINEYKKLMTKSRTKNKLRAMETLVTGSSGGNG